MTVNSKSIRDVAVVTGGGSGIGAACCRELAAGGSLVAVLDQNREAADRLADEVGGAAFECDISSEDELMETAKRIESNLGGVRVLVNCAGVVQGRAGVYELPMRKWDDIVRIDQRGTYLSCIVFARAMLERRRGSIVNVASVAGMRSMPLHAYAPAKAAVISMTETLAAEWGASGIRVNAVSPGFTMTERMRAAIEKGIMDDKPLTSTAALHRLVEPSEVAKAIAFLASDNASAITGINLPVDCGWLAGATWSAYGGLPDGTKRE
jgi:NAD(P)-dependent dehydrogenase (short-subunit alcohol dehydrogenase family)